VSIVGTLLGSNELLVNATTVTVTATSTNGSTWVVWCASNGGFGATPITDNKGNTYTQIQSNVTAFTVTGTLWYKENGTGGASHTWTGTPLGSALSTLIVVEITGGLSSGIFDQSAAALDDLATPFTSNVTGTTTQANELVLAFMFDNRSAGATTWGNSYVSLVDLANTTGVTAGAAKLNVTATGTQQSSFTNANVTEAVTWIATFKEAAGVAVNLMGKSIWMTA
jgi:hypothetical protein